MAVQGIKLERGDITMAAVDAIVNAANSNLVLGGGVCGAIHSAGGPTIAAECLRILVKRGALEQGSAVATKAGNLPAKYVIHAVGPSWGGGAGGAGELLASTYRSAIRAADELGLHSVAFPSISTGMLGYPAHEAAPVALRAVREAIQQARHVREVRFILSSDKTHSAYKQALDELDS